MINAIGNFIRSSSRGGYPEYPGGALTEGVHSYASTFDDLTLTSLKARYYYPTNYTSKLPVMLVIHGYEDIAVTVGEDNFRRFARYGYFVIAVEMRGSSGSGGSGGTRDAGGREIFDCYDAYQSVLSTFSAEVHATRLSIVGFSAGGGVALAFSCRFPDLAQVCVDYFGISDWGYDATFGWYAQTSAARQTSLQSYIGGTPAAAPDNYKARDSRSAIAKNFQGHLYMFHAPADSAVPVNQSQRVEAQYIAEGRTDYTYSELAKWTHAYPSGSNDLEDAEVFWKDSPKTEPVVSVPAVGTMKILGSLITKRFKIHLSDGNENNAGRSRVADLVYDVSANTYTITPLIDATGGAGYLVATVTLPDGRVSSQAIVAETTLQPATIAIAGLTPSMRLRANNVLVTGSLVAWVDACGGPNGQGYAVRNTVQLPQLLPADINGLPSVEFTSTDYLQGTRHRALIGTSEFTRIVVGTGVTIDQGPGISSLLQTQHVITGGSCFVALSNGSSSYGSYAASAIYKVRSDVFNGAGALNADRLKCYEDKVLKSLTFVGTIPSAPESNSGSFKNIGKRNYDGTYLNGKLADYVLFEEALSTVNREAVEDELKTLYAI